MLQLKSYTRIKDKNKNYLKKVKNPYNTNKTITTSNKWSNNNVLTINEETEGDKDEIVISVSETDIIFGSQ